MFEVVPGKFSVNNGGRLCFFLRENIPVFLINGSI